MQIRCTNCHRPFALNRQGVHTALDQFVTEDLKHFDAYCPHCRRANRISREVLLRAAPDCKPTPPTAEPDTEVAPEEVKTE